MYNYFWKGSMTTTHYHNSTLSSIKPEVTFTAKYNEDTKQAVLNCYGKELKVHLATKEEYQVLKDFLIHASTCIRVDGWNTAIRHIRETNKGTKPSYRKTKQDDRNVFLEGLGFYLFEDMWGILWKSVKTASTGVMRQVQIPVNTI